MLQASGMIPLGYAAGKGLLDPKEDAMVSCSEEPSELLTGPRWWEQGKHCPNQQRGLIIRRPARMRNLDVQVRHGPIAHPRIYPRVDPMGRLIDLEYMDGFEKAAKVANLRRVRRVRERSRARRLAV